MKEAILATLNSQHSLVRQQVANLIAAIAGIEIPRGEWHDLIHILCNNADHTEYNVRLTSLTTLGYICEEISPDAISDQTKNSIIVALTNNINGNSQVEQDIEPCRLATRAMIYSVPHASQNFKVENERNFIMDRLFQACQHSNEEIVENALHCIREITTQEYETMQYYFDQICLATSTLAKHPSSKVGAQAYEYWTTLIEDETERIEKNVTCINYISRCYQNLIDLIIEGLCIINFDENEDDDEWGHALSAACCL